MNIGILGLGNIAKRVANGIHHANDATLYAVASRDLNKAKAFKNETNAKVAYGNYDDMCKDKNVDIIYICTPNQLHKEHILKCLSYHKHVLCEKPMLINQEDLEECFNYAKKQNCFLMEMHKTLFTPLNLKLKKMIQEGIIGNIQMIDASYCSLVDIHTIPQWCLDKTYGGCLNDIGVYPISYCNYFAQSNLSDIQVMKRYAKDGYVTQTQGMLKYENGIMAHFMTSWDSDNENIGYIYGDKGHIKCYNFWKNTEAFLIKNGKEEKITVSMKSDFTGEIEHAISMIQQNKLQSDLLNEHNSKQIIKVISKTKRVN